MMRAYFGDGGEERTYTRSSSHGYTSLVVDADVKMPCFIDIVAEDSVLRCKKVDEPTDDKEEYTFICKEFGLFGYSKGIEAKVSIMFCDDGWMMVTLLSGALALEYNGDIILPTVGDAYNGVTCDTDSIYWVNQDTLLGRKKYYGDDYASRCVQDFEYLFVLKGMLEGGLSSFGMNCKSAEYADLSRGYITACRTRAEQRAKIRDAKRVMREVESAMNSSSGGLELDGEEEYQSQLVFEEEEEEDWE